MHRQIAIADENRQCKISIDGRFPRPLNCRKGFSNIADKYWYPEGEAEIGDDCRCFVGPMTTAPFLMWKCKPPSSSTRSTASDSQKRGAALQLPYLSTNVPGQDDLGPTAPSCQLLQERRDCSQTLMHILGHTSRCWKRTVIRGLAGVRSDLLTTDNDHGAFHLTEITANQDLQKKRKMAISAGSHPFGLLSQCLEPNKFKNVCIHLTFNKTFTQQLQVKISSLRGPST